MVLLWSYFGSFSNMMPSTLLLERNHSCGQHIPSGSPISDCKQRFRVLHIYHTVAHKWTAHTTTLTHFCLHLHTTFFLIVIIFSYSFYLLFTACKLCSTVFIPSPQFLLSVFISMLFSGKNSVKIGYNLVFKERRAVLKEWKHI